MRTAAKVLSIGAILGGVVVFTVVAPEQTRSVARSLEAVLDKKAVEGHYQNGFMGKESSAWKSVDWETVKAAKMGFFERAKKAQNVEEVRTLVLKAGVPEDHVDYFVNKWVESAKSCDAKEGAEMDECYKAAADWHHHHGTEDSAHGTPQSAPAVSSAKPSDGGCYNAAGTHEIVCEADGAAEASCGGKWIQSCSAIGYACCGGTPATPVDHHSASWSAWKSVDWETVKAAKLGFFERAKSAEDVRPLAAGLRARVVQSGVPEDSVDSMVSRWATAAEACNGKEAAEKEDCYKKAADCHGGHHGFTGTENSAWKDINWDMVKAAKMDYFERVKAAHSFAAGLRARVVGAGVPEDHVDSMVSRWVKAAEACDGKKGAEMDECYNKAAECPFKGKENSAWKDVDWETVKAIKTGYFERAKTTEKQNAEEVQKSLRTQLVNAKVPDDHLDLFVKKWMEAAEACDGKEGAERDACLKTATDWHHHHVAESDVAQPGAESATESVAEDASATEQPSYLKLRRLIEGLFSALYQKLGDLVKHVLG
jgi:hypothetical protein